MPTSSIFKNFVISGKKQVEKFVAAFKASAKDQTSHVPINITYLRGSEEVANFFAEKEENE